MQFGSCTGWGRAGRRGLGYRLEHFGGPIKFGIRQLLCKARHGTARHGKSGQDHGENRKPRTMCPSCSSVLPAPVPRSTNLQEGVTHNPTNQRRTKQTNRPTSQVAVAACETVVSCVTCDLFHLLFDHNKPVSQQVSPVCMSKYALTDGLDFPYRLLLWSDSRPP